jgi:hypothetical protein
MPEIDIQLVDSSANSWFTKLMTYYTGKFDNFWWLGNCFDTLTDYLLVFGADNPASAVSTVLQKFDSIRKNHDQSKKVDTWYDDWAWWAIASAKAFDPRYAGVFGSNAGPFADVARTCWTIVDQGLGDGVHLGAPNGYLNRENLTKWDPKPTPLPGWYGPLFEGGPGSGLHGTWQYDIFSNWRGGSAWKGPAEGNDESNPSWPLAPKWSWGGPFQLTVMNALYLLLAARLEQARGQNQGVPQASVQLKDQLGFLWAWFGKDKDHRLPDGVPGLLKPAGNQPGDGVVVRERVSRYALHDGSYDEVYTFDERCTWGGDIGLVLNGLATYLALHPETDPERPIASLMKDLVRGYMSLLFGGRYPQPYYPPGEGVFGLDPDDYRSGIGVFMRGLYQAFHQDASPLWELLKPHTTLRDFLTYSGQWALKQEITDKTDAFDCLNVLATLTAVKAIPH